MKTEKLRKLSITKREGAAWALCLVLAAALVIGAVSAGSWYFQARESASTTVISCCQEVTSYSELSEASAPFLLSDLHKLNQAVDSFRPFQKRRNSKLLALEDFTMDAGNLVHIFTGKSRSARETERAAELWEKELQPLLRSFYEYYEERGFQCGDLEKGLGELEKKMDAVGYDKLHYEVTDLQNGIWKDS